MAPSPIQIILIIVAILLLFGTKRVPAMMENLAKGITSFKKGLKEEEAPAKKVTAKKTSSKKK